MSSFESRIQVHQDHSPIELHLHKDNPTHSNPIDPNEREFSEQLEIQREVSELNEPQRMTLKEWYASLYDRFDPSFLFIFQMSQTNLGFLVFFLLEFKDYGKHYLGMSVDQLQMANSMFFVPWTFKLFYGLISDSFPIFGFKRKYYLMCCGIIASFSILALVMPWSAGIFSFYFCGVLHMAAFAFNDVLVDSIMVSESKKDPVRGSESLQSLGFSTHAISGIISAIMGGIFTEFVHPKIGLTLYSFFGFTIAWAAYRYQDTYVMIFQTTGMCKHAGNQLSMMWKALFTPIIFKVFLFMFFSAAIVPRFHEYKYYYLIDVLGFTELQYGLLFLMTMLTMLIIVVVFYQFLKHYSYKQAIILGLTISFVTTFFDLLLYLNFFEHIGVSKYIFILFTNVFEDFISMRYIIIATTVICARVTPNYIEASIFALLIGISNLGFGVCASIHGNFWAKVLAIDEDTMENMHLAMAVKLAFSLVPYLMVFWIPNKEEIESDPSLKELNKKQEREEKLIDEDGDPN